MSGHDYIVSIEVNLVVVKQDFKNYWRFKHGLHVFYSPQLFNTECVSLE